MNQSVSFNLYGTSFILSIRYQDENEWLKTSFTIRFKDIINYQAKNVEIFTNECVNILIDYLEKHIRGAFKKEKKLSFYEPDFEFVFIPKKLIRSDDIDPNSDYIQTNEYMELRVHFWNKGLTENFLSLCFEREDVKKLYNYLVYTRASYEKANQQKV